MAWDQLAIDKPHLAYIIIGGFTSLFMLVSLFVKEKLYIGEATVATICGIIFGPHAANLIDPNSWGNVDKITLECSRIVLVVQCFAVGVELPKAYMERHWRSVVFLLVPVMTFGWLMTSIFIWWMIVPLSWLDSLVVAACVTATDPVLASSVVGKGKFAKRVPKHLRDVLSAESGCNDGMAFPFIYLSLYLIRYNLQGREVVFHWVCFTILYECVFGAFYGFMIGYIARHAIKLADRKNLVDRESFLAFYFVLALFCAGSGSLLGMDDLLIGFSAGVGFSNDGWFTQKTEEAHVSNVIDLLLNLAYFVYFGAIVPWEQYNNIAIGLQPWRLVVIAIMVILFRRIPAMMALKPFIPDVKNWREALFAGHFGPIGVGAVFAAILARAELESDSTQPLANLPTDPNSPNYLVIQLIWPVVTFLVVTSIIVHGSSIAVFTLGKHINTLTLTMSYTQGNNDPGWLNRLPRISSVSRSMSKGKGDEDSDEDEKLAFPPGTLGPLGFPGNFLRRQREEDNPSRNDSRASSLRPASRRKKNAGEGYGGPISQSAIMPQRRSTAASPEPTRRKPQHSRHDSEAKSVESEQSPHDSKDADVEAYEEGGHMIIEDEEGNVLQDKDVHDESHADKLDDIEDARDELARETSGEHAKHKGESHEKNEGEEFRNEIVKDLDYPAQRYRRLRKRLEDWNTKRREDAQVRSVEQGLRGPAHAYQYGNTIIVEDEDGEVVKKYDIPPRERKRQNNEAEKDQAPIRKGLHRMGTWAGFSKPNAQEGAAEDPTSDAEEEKLAKEYDDDDRIRFRIGSGTRRMSKQDFIKQIQSLDPKARIEAIQDSEGPSDAKQDVAKVTVGRQLTAPDGAVPRLKDVRSSEQDEPSNNGKELAAQADHDVPMHSVSQSLARLSHGQPETAAQRRRRQAALQREGLEDDGAGSKLPATSHASGSNSNQSRERTDDDPTEEGETAAERHRRLAALGRVPTTENEPDSDDDGEERQPRWGRQPVPEPDSPASPRSPGIRFAEAPTPSQTGSRVQWAAGARSRPSNGSKRR